MNETIKTILNRRSTRVFTEENITDEILEQILEAGLYAPSAHNSQSWHFTVITNNEILEKMNLDTKEIARNSDDDFLKKLGNNDKYHIFYNAPVAIIVSGEDSAPIPKINTANASENMLLAAESLDIGACWIEVVGILFNDEKKDSYKKDLGIPNGYTPYHAIILGHKKIKSNNTPKRRENLINYIK